VPELRTRLRGAVLAARLAALVEHGLLERVRYRTEPDWYEYRLTRAGLDLFPAILTIKSWADEHLFDPKGSRLHVRHRACGAELIPVVVCESCREPISATDAEFEAS
jgi:DNA-binding HxlR family transcriptional regulator